MNEHQKDVLNKITEHHGPWFTIFALAIMYRWSITAGIGSTAMAAVTGKLVGWW